MEGVNGGVIFCSHVVEVEEEARRGGGAEGGGLQAGQGAWRGSLIGRQQQQQRRCRWRVDFLQDLYKMCRILGGR